MDRTIVYAGALPLETDLLSSQKNSMIGVGKLAEAVLGYIPLAYGFVVSPDSPGSLNVVVGPGQLYLYTTVDATAYSSLDADTDRYVMKQALLMENVTLNCPAPGVAGQSINYLVQVAFEEVDEDLVLLPYYNASNPSQPYAGPNNNGVSQSTVRRCKAVVTVKAGVAATTGTQTTPSPDTDNAGIKVVTVAYGQTVIGNSHITEYYDAISLPRSGVVWDSRNLLYSKSIAGGGNITLSADEGARPIIVLTGALTANAHVIVPSGTGQWVIINDTTGAYDVYITMSASGTDTDVAQGTAAVVVCDGSLVRSVSGGGGGSSFIQTHEFTATAAQTSFTLSYTVGSIFLVFRNGASVPFTATSGSAVVLDEACDLNDEVVILEGSAYIAISDVVQATETISGKAEVADETEALTGSSDDKMMTPLKTKRLFTATGQQSLTTNGYQKLPGGLIIQWGTISSASSSGSSVNTATTFPISFPNNAFSLTISGTLSSNDRVAYSSLTTSGFTANVSDPNGGTVQAATLTYIAIGN